jgi:hypothetical protein
MVMDRSLDLAHRFLISSAFSELLLGSRFGAHLVPGWVSTSFRRRSGGSAREGVVNSMQNSGFGETCQICGGDGRISNAFGGSSTTCPGCHGSGRRADSGSILRDVTKTKPSHYRTADKAAAEAKSNWPSTFEAVALANEVKASGLSEDGKARLIREIVEYEGTHGKSTQTFSKKVRRQIRPPQK